MKMERCLLVTIELESEADKWPNEDVSRELEELTKTAGGRIIQSIFLRRNKPSPNLFIGKGKAEEIMQLSEAEYIDTIIFSHDLSGTQQRDLEAIINRKTIDRTQLILDIFAKHAQSPEGNLQVELAQLEYLLPRLTGKGILLSRLGGGIGTRGPGEQKLEIDRRRIRQRITRLKQELKGVSVHRALLRKKRKEKELPSIVLIGYTNTGKSTLFNALTGISQAVIRNSLFTTLDSLCRHFELRNIGSVTISDTVGFLHHLPHHLIEAFKATLEEINEADLLLHILDINHPRLKEYYQTVLEVLKDLGYEHKSLITVLNKIDLMEDKVLQEWIKKDFPDSVSISAKTGENKEELTKRMEDFFKFKLVETNICLPLNRMDLVDLLYREGRVKKIDYQEKSINIDVVLTKPLLNNLLKNREVTITD